MGLSGEKTLGVAIFFTRALNKFAIDVIPDIFGRYDEGGFLFVSETQIELFYAVEGDGYCKRVHSKRSRCEVWDTEKFSFDFLLLPVDVEEARRIYDTCDACVKVRKPYNMRDMILIHIPFRQPDELSLVEAPSLSNPQAIILILRESLNSENTLRHGLEGLHSRQTLLSTLHDRLSPHTLPVVWDSLINLVKCCER